MIYKEFKDKKLSALGFGMMRLPVIDKDDSKIDEAKVQEMVDKAFEGGINYFDTAYGYHQGVSEIVTGKVLKKYPRDSFYLATKFPGYDPENWKKVEEIFEKQLEKLQVEYFDFYLFHNVSEKNIDAYMNEEYGIFDYLIKQKQNGRIKHLGFSTHASIENMKRFLEKYGKDMEFCQIQLNYLDYKLQYAKEKVELLDSYNIPVWVMEPLRGGRLNRLSEKEAELLSKIRPEESNVTKAFRFVQSIPQVTMTLSGMGTMEQLEENMATFSENKPYSEEEMKELMAVSDEMLSSKMLPCTVCRYCENHCPMELPISDMVAMYNEYSFSEGGMLTPMRMATVPENKRPANCVGCKSCEQVCPQNIKISEMMADFAEKVKEMKL